MNSAAVVMASSDKSCQSKGACGCLGGKSAGYLAALTLAAWGVQVPMLLVAVPKFAERLRDFGVQVPEVTRLVVNWSQWMQSSVGGTMITGAMVFSAAVALLAVVAFVIAKVGGRGGKALVVLLALLGGAIACGQAAAVIFPAVSAQRTVNNPSPAP